MECGYHSGDDLPNSQLYRSYNTHDPLPAGSAAVQLVGVLEGDHSLLEPHDLDTVSQHSAHHTLPRRCHRNVAHLLRGLLEPPLLGAEIVLVDAGGPAHRGPGGGAQGGRGRGGAEGGEHEPALGAGQLDVGRWRLVEAGGGVPGARVLVLSHGHPHLLLHTQPLLTQTKKYYANETIIIFLKIESGY